MTQLERVKHWLGDWNGSIYSANTVGARYYSYTFDSNASSKWEGEFYWHLEDAMNNKQKHVVDLSTGRLLK